MRSGWILLLLVTSACLPGCDAAQDERAEKIGTLRAALNETHTRTDFTRVAEAAGLSCKSVDEIFVACSWIDIRPLNGEPLTACPDKVLPAISASRNFPGGQRQGDYHVQETIAGC
jgi:hypothetical protein